MKQARDSETAHGRRQGAEWLVTAPSFLWLAVFFAVPALIVLAFTFHGHDASGGVGDWSLSTWRELWHYYHAQPNANPNASFYDIRLHFQGATVDAKGKAKMNSTSADETYTSLLANLRVAMKNLARQVEPKVYEYGFLKK